MKDDLPPRIPDQDEEPYFFPVSGLKLVVMSTVTFGLYEIYWFYRNWKFVQKRLGRDDIMPFWRAFFAFFFCYSLFRTVNDSAASQGVPSTTSPALLTLAWIGLTLCWRLPDPFWLVAVFAVLALLPIQRVVNDLNAYLAPNHKPNARFSAWNIVGIVLGGLLFVLAIVSTFLPE